MKEQIKQSAFKTGAAFTPSGTGYGQKSGRSPPAGQKIRSADTWDQSCCQCPHLDLYTVSVVWALAAALVTGVSKSGLLTTNTQGFERRKQLVLNT